MSRPLRIEFPGAFYHVMNRGICRREVFHAEEYAQLFYDLLEEIHKRYQIEIHAFCLMGNHYHLCVRTVHANLGKAMQHFVSVFTKRYNKLIKGDGPLFRGRYKAILVETNTYFLRLTRYIYQNPVKAGIVKNLREYQWSSYKYLFNKNESIKPNWLYFAKTLKYFGGADPILAYEKFILEGTDLEFENFFKNRRQFPILGSDSFVDKVKNGIYQPDTEFVDKEIPDLALVINHDSIPIDTIINAVIDYFGVELNSILEFNTSEDCPRRIAIYLAVMLSGKCQKVVAKYFSNISYGWVSKIYRSVQVIIKEDAILSRDICNIINLLQVNKPST